MENKESKTLSESYLMIGGDGPRSYTQNSRYQKGVVDSAKELMNKAIANKLDFKNFCFDTSNTFYVTDLGCSVGPNTFIAVQNIMEAAEHEHPELPLEFQVFFNYVSNWCGHNGFISEEKVDSFNLPLYYVSKTELQKLIDGNGYFSIEIMETLTNPMMQMKFTVPFMTSQLRAAFEGIIKEHFGNEITDEICNYFAKNLAENLFIFDKISHQHIELFILLKRNMD